MWGGHLVRHAPAPQEVSRMVGGVLGASVAAEQAGHSGGCEYFSEVADQGPGCGFAIAVNDCGPSR